MIARPHHLGLAALLAVSACGAEVETVTPLFDHDHPAEVLNEARVLSNPRSIQHNRLLRGWRFIENPDGRRVAPDGSVSVVELVHLERRPRRLILELTHHQPGDTVRVSAGGRDLGVHPISDRTEITLRADLPLGRAAVELAFSDPGSIVLQRMLVDPARPPGDASVDESTVALRGWTAVEVVRRLALGSVLEASFEPPSDPEPGQRFTATIELPGGGGREIVIWDAATGSDDIGAVHVEIPIGGGAELARIRLSAAGAGPPGRWLDPRIIHRKKPPKIQESVEIPALPRLVVLYVMDALRADHVGSARNPTPTLDRVAADGVRFSNHFAVAPNTPPSTRALFSGLCMLDDRQLPDPGPTRLAEVFHEAGYRTVSITGNPHLSPDLDLATGFDRVELLRLREDHHPDHPPTVNDSAAILHDAAASWLDELGSDGRGFVYLHSMNPHNPYTPPPELEPPPAAEGSSTIDGRTRTLVAIRDQERDVSAGDIERIRKLYAAGVTYNDRELGLLLDEISKRFAPGEVLMIVTSDHGEELFEHDGVLHGYTLYDEMLRIPLIVSWPGRVDPRTVAEPTTTLDLHTTLIELLGRRPEHPAGRSLWPEILGAGDREPGQRLTFAVAPGLDGAVMVRSARWKLIQAPRNGVDRGQGHGRGRSSDLEYAFDLEADPGERHNLAGTHDLEVSWLRTRLAGWLEMQRARQPRPGDQEMDAATKEQLKALGYVVE